MTAIVIIFTVSVTIFTTFTVDMCLTFRILAVKCKHVNLWKPIHDLLFDSNINVCYICFCLRNDHVWTFEIFDLQIKHICCQRHHRRLWCGTENWMAYNYHHHHHHHSPEPARSRRATQSYRVAKKWRIYLFRFWL